MGVVRILGIDPGTRVAGYGIIEMRQQVPKALAVGVWRLENSGTLPMRLATLACAFRDLVQKYQPTHMCIELAFFAKNARSALMLGAARGVFLSEAHLAGLIISEVSATSAKKSITANGRADKSIVARILADTLGVSLDNLPFDASDALAIAYSQAIRIRNVELLQNQGGDRLIDPALLASWNPLRVAKKKETRKGFEALARARAK